jgi:hypothetical protein
MFYGNFAEEGLKRYYFPQNLKRPKNDQIILFLTNCFKKGQMATLGSLYLCTQAEMMLVKM